MILPGRKFLLTSTIALGLLSNACKETPIPEASSNPDLEVEELVASEEWIELMSAEMKRRFQEVDQLPIAKESAFPFPAIQDFVVSGRLRKNSPTSTNIAGRILESLYEFEGDSGRTGRLWNFLESPLTGLREAKFSFLKGAFPNSEKTSYQATVRFTCKGRLGDGRIATFEALQDITWQLAGETIPNLANNYLINPSEWVIDSWKLKEARLLASEAPLFKEVTMDVIVEKEARLAIASPVHGQHLEALFAGKEIPLKKGQGQFFTTDATAQHPGLSVVDINDDGWDDLYVCVRFGRNLLFQNLGNGTFEEVASEYGLDLDGLSACSIFADFDNDGDQDVVIGRSLERSVYLQNNGGRFENVSSSHVACPLPYLTTSLSAADYNGDGLLDLYFSTYGFAQRQQKSQVAERFLSDYPAELVAEKFVSVPNVQQFLDLPGPPNLLLVNTGDGHFAVSPFNRQVETWHETLQSTWADFDQDGFPDLYVCNDFAADQLYHNEQGKGFREVTESIGHDRMRGFGMGASFGDFDNDQDLDLYVSNMFSKAGLRIIDQVPAMDERFRWSAEGNLLFESKNGKAFNFISLEESPFSSVAQADWSWGGQFCDLDGDGFLDLYVPNGYFTAPEKFSGEVDL